MKAVGITQYLPINHPESLLDVELPIPIAQGHDLLVRVKAVSVNPVDTKMRASKDGKENSPRVLGWDAAGIVEAVGEHVTLFQPGDEVYYAGSIGRAGCNSEYHLVDERIVGHKPRSLSFAQAAAMPLTTITAWECLFDRLAIKQQPNSEQTVLIIGGAGGVGSIAIQLAKRVAGLRVIATASRPETQNWCRDLGADYVLDHRKPLAESLSTIGITEVNYVLCLNSTEKYLPQLPAIVAPQGKVAIIVGTKNYELIDINPFQSKSISLNWELMFTRPLFNTDDMHKQHDLLNAAANMFDEGTLRHTLTQDLGPLTAAALRRAHAQIESGTTIGKLVLTGIA